MIRLAAGLVALGLAPVLGCSSNQLLATGARPPDLSAVDQHGTEHRLTAERGHPVVVFFYPKDGTPGCTEEACAFRDVWDQYRAASVQVFGVSTDDAESKAEFADEHDLPFPVLADPDGRWLDAFGVGTTLGMASRVTFLLDAEGKVAKVYPEVDPGVHATEVLRDAKALRGAPQP